MGIQETSTHRLRYFLILPSKVLYQLPRDPKSLLKPQDIPHSVQYYTKVPPRPTTETIFPASFPSLICVHHE